MHDRVSVNAICFPGEPLEKVMGYWRELAPHRVSLVSQFLARESLASTKALLGATDYQIETVTHLFSPRAPLSDRAGWDVARKHLAEIITGAEAVGAKSIYMLTGARGPLIWEAAAEAFAEAIAPCVRQAKEAGVALLTEPASPSYADLHIAHSLKDTVLLAETADIGVSIDLFPCWAEAGLQETIIRALPRCGLVQVGDYVLGDRGAPCRAVVGEGDLPIERMLGWIFDAGYKGAIDLELLGPRIDQAGWVEAARRSANKVGEILASHHR